MTAVLACASSAQTPELEKILFPIVAYYEVPGAFGTRWRTDVSVRNTSDRALTMSGGFLCFECRTPQKLLPGVTYRFLPDNGTFLRVEREFADRVKFSVRLVDASQTAIHAGTDLPVVREREFSDTRIDLLGIPSDPGFRHLLRVYSFEPMDGEVLVKLYLEAERTFPHGNGVPYPADELLAERIVRLVPPAPPTDRRPSSAAIADLPLPMTGTTRLEILPLTSGLRIWGFLSVTNNATQAVTLVVPH